MATIPSNQKILTSAPEVNTTYGGPASLQALNTWYTMEDIANTVRPYKVYTALLTQTGTSAPVATILENTANLTVTYTYNNPGIYLFSFVKLSSEKVVINVSTKFGSFGNIVTNSYTINPTSVSGTITVSSSGPSNGNDALLNQPIEIRIYP